MEPHTSNIASVEAIEEHVLVPRYGCEVAGAADVTETELAAGAAILAFHRAFDTAEV